MPETVIEGGRGTGALPDIADLRDHVYEPSLVPLEAEKVPDPLGLTIGDQRNVSSCTGFALAAVIDRLRGTDNPADQVSPKMLYRMARLHDDLPGDVTKGSTLRGALKGFYHNGVCKESDAPYDLRTERDIDKWELTPSCAQAARRVSLGAYFRLNHVINDYHTAINETGALYVSAQIHDGWEPDRIKHGIIQSPRKLREYHAFAIIGYTTDGFIIQNSWGHNWGGFRGLKGAALWRYADWHEHVQDAWVLRLGISSENAFDYKVASNFGTFAKPNVARQILAPRRQDIFGHYLNLDDGKYVNKGRFSQTHHSIAGVVEVLRKGETDDPEPKKINHLLFYAHGALTTRDETAKRIRAWKRVFMANGIYPMHLMWQTGFNNGTIDLLQDVLLKTYKRMGEHESNRDARLEEMARPLGRKLWRDLGKSAEETLDFKKDGGKAVLNLLRAAKISPSLKVHFAGVSAGAFLLKGLSGLAISTEVPLSSVTLFAPVIPVEEFEKHIKNRMGDWIESVEQFNLSRYREDNDSVKIYRKSLLHLVKNALEYRDDSSLLGMQTDYEAAVKVGKLLHPKNRLYVSGEDKRSITDARTHRGFENDVATMNSLLRHILGARPAISKRFSEQDLDSYGGPDYS